jgi:hypothetical protein
MQYSAMQYGHVSDTGIGERISAGSPRETSLKLQADDDDEAPVLPVKKGERAAGMGMAGKYVGVTLRGGAASAGARGAGGSYVATESGGGSQAEFGEFDCGFDEMDI